MICEICNRPMSDDLISSDEHHWIPKSKGGKDTSRLHKICHRKIHSMWTETELSKYYNTPERILENDQMVSFVKWLKNKPVDFYIGSRDSNVRKSKRKR